MLERRRIFLGKFDTFEEAVQARIEAENKNKEKEISDNKFKTENDITQEINSILDDKKIESETKEAKNELVEAPKANYFNTIEPQELPRENVVPKEENNASKEDKPLVEKPKINVDVDSVVINNKSNNDDFFDDFFGGEDE